MNVKIGVLFILPALLTGVAACQYWDNSDYGPREPGASGISELSQPDTSTEMNQPESTDVKETGDISVFLQGKSPEDIFESLGEDAYVTYTYIEASSHTDAPKNIHLLDDWVEKYRSGEASVLWLLEEVMGGKSYWLLESNGTATYSIYVPRGTTWNHYESSIVIKRETDYLFGTDKLDEWFPVWQYKVVRHTVPAITWIEDYDLVTLPTLGVTTPSQAGEIAKRWDMQVYSHFSDYGTGNFSGKGQFFPYDYTHTELDTDQQEWLNETLHAVVLASVMIDERPFYVFGVAVDPDMGFGAIYAVNADGGHLVYDVSVNEYNFRLWGDSTQECISPTG